MNSIRIGFALTGSFCTFHSIFEPIEKLVETGNRVTPILSYTVSSTDTRFINKEDLVNRLEAITGQTIIQTLAQAEPIGPKQLLDILIIAPCTGNTLAKITNGVTDTPVTLAYKAHLRNERPVVIALSTNDGLGANAKNLGCLLNTKNIYFVPFGQDDPMRKTHSLVADFTKIPRTIERALAGEQIQPILI